MHSNNNKKNRKETQKNTHLTIAISASAGGSVRLGCPLAYLRDTSRQTSVNFPCVLQSVAVTRSCVEIYVYSRRYDMYFRFCERRHCVPIGNESVPIQLAQCWFSGGRPFPMLKYVKIFFSNKVCGSNFIKQNSETVIVGNYQKNADCSLKNSLRHLLYNFRHTFVPHNIPG